MLNLIDFTDRGIFFIINEPQHNCDKNLAKIGFKSIDSMNPSNKEEFKKAIEELELYNLLVFPVDNINPNFSPNKIFNSDEIKKVPTFRISRNEVPNYGYLFLDEDRIKKQERFNSILKKHKNKITPSTKEDFRKEVIKAINEINEYNHLKFYNLIGFDYNGKLLCNVKGMLKQEIFNNYKETETKKFFSVVLNERMQKLHISSTDELNMEAFNKLLNHFVENVIKSDSLLKILLENLEVEDFDDYIEVNFNGNIEIYSKSQLFEELMSDYDKDYAKDEIKKILKKLIEKYFSPK